MNITINSKVLDESFTFWAPDNGGYVRLETTGNTGSLGTQICYGGDMRGNTVSCADEVEFKRECRQWVKDRIAWMRKECLIF